MVARRAHCLALDFGASNIRLAAVGLSRGRLRLREIARFHNGPCPEGGRLVWDYPSIFNRIGLALQSAGRGGRMFSSIGVDSWGVDYVLMAKDGRLLAPAVSYRDPRTDGQVERYAAKHFTPSQMFAVTGLPSLPFNTLFQLYAQSQTEPEILRRAHRLLFTADYVHYWLSGVAATELTLASTSQMLTLNGRWWPEALRSLALHPAALADPVPPGTVLGEIRPSLSRSSGLAGVAVIAPAAHDTQSAILAVPADDDGDWAYLSSGTWSILGVESAVPFNNRAAEAAGLGNEQGYGDTFCVQSTVTGLWLVQEMQRLFEKVGAHALAEQAETAEPFRSLVNPADPRFLHPADMMAEIRAACRDAGEPIPVTLGQLVRCAYDSLALLYRQRLNLLSEVIGRSFKRLHVVGGGSKAMLLNRLCAAATGLTVLAGPAEATALGNALAQMLALGALKSVDEARHIVRISFPPEVIEPVAMPGLERAVVRFERLGTPQSSEEWPMKTASAG